MGLKEFQIKSANRQKEFYSKTVNLINTKLLSIDIDITVDCYYRCYDINVGNHILDGLIPLNKFLLDNKIEVSKLLNNEVVNRHKESYNNRHNKAVDTFGTDYDNIRVSTDYIDNGHKLIDHTIKVDQVDDDS
jgi:hypothetical protein